MTPTENNANRLLPQPGPSDRMRHPYAAAFFALREAGLAPWLALCLAYNGYTVLPLSALEAK